MEYEIVKVKSPLEQESEPEPLGTKEKFWYLDDTERIKKLFKSSRQNTGEHWSEKVAEQFCDLLGIPHAQYELAVHEKKGRETFGVVSTNLIPTNCRMVMGNG